MNYTYLRVTFSFTKITYSYPKVTYSYTKVTHSDPNVTNSDPTHLPLPLSTSSGPDLLISHIVKSNETSGLVLEGCN